MRKIISILFFPILLFAKFQVTTTFPLETFIVEQLAKNNIRVKQIDKTLSLNERNFTQKELSSFSSVWVYFHFGFDVEKNYAKKLSQENKELLIYDVSEGIKKDTFNGKVNHFVWTDPILMRKIVLNVHKTLIKLDKFHKEQYDENLNKFLDKLDKLFWEVKRKLDKSNIFNIIVFDEDWYYFIQRFRINLYRYNKENVKSKKIKKLRTFISQNEIKAMLINSSSTYILAKVLIINTDIKLIMHNIFDKKYFENLEKLSNDLS